ncbi:MAG: 16S rRNA (guanine(527)-N(7))-methyltransferase RsmG [Phycisphaerales bacterium]
MTSTSPLAPTPEFLALCTGHGIAFDEGDVERLGRYLSLLLDANTRFNLTAITDPALGWTRHVFDSLTLMGPLAAVGAERVIDVGSGGGAPGIPLAICMPSVAFTLLEATTKKATFLRHAATELGLDNVQVVNDRAETAGRGEASGRERFDAVVARAVGPLDVLLELTVPFARVGGLVLAIKERRPRTRSPARQALHRLHATVIDSIRGPTGTLVVVEKRRPTPRARIPRSGRAEAPAAWPARRLTGRGAGSQNADGRDKPGRRL